MIVQHSAKNDAWGTPTDIIEASREVMGSIDFDPCSSAEGNLRVKATDWSDAGLCRVLWHGNMLINPPGGRIGKAKLPVLFWHRLLTERQNIKQAIVVGFTLEHLMRTQESPLGGMLNFPLCVPSRRLSFFPLVGQEVSSPGHANVIVYVPGREDRTRRFVDAFTQFGECKI